MALQVWLPLNGDLTNQGCSSVTVTNNGATIDNSGKIGKCYTFNGNDSYISISSTKLFNCFKGGSTPFSLAFWIYNGEASGARAILFGDYSTTGGVSINIELNGNLSNNSIRFYWGSNPDWGASNSILVPNTWSHATITYDGSAIKIYINGILKDTRTGVLISMNKTSGAFFLGRDGRTGATALNGKMNDVRIYDHCLSAAEVKELSQGLVLHYKFDDPYVEATTNLASQSYIDGWNNSGSCTRTNNDTTLSSPTGSVVFSQIETTAGQCAFCIGATSSAQPSKTLTASTWFYRSGDANGNSISPYIRDLTHNNSIASFTYNGIGGHANWPKNKWIYITCTFTTASNAGKPYICSYTGALNEKFAFTGWQIEEKDHATPYTPSSRSSSKITDSSGYGHHSNNLTTTTAPIIGSDSPRYNISTKFDTTTKKVDVSFTCPGLSDSYSISWWGKMSDYSGKMFWGFNTALNYYDGLYWNMGDGSGNPFYVPNTTTTISKPSVNVWHYFVITGDGSSTKLFLDGQHYGTAKTYRSLSNISSFRINGWVYDESYRNAGMQISDFRLYSTVLSADDVKRLYNTSALIDNKGRLHAYSNVEISTVKPTILKSGIVETDLLTEFVSTSYDKNYYVEPDGSIWVRITHHNNPTSYKFNQSNSFNSQVYIDENRWFKVSLCNRLTNTWELMIKQKSAVDSTEIKYRWIQLYNPMTATYAQTTAANVTKITSSGYTDYSNYGGLYYSNGNTYLVTNNGTEGNWYGAIGCWTEWSGGIPGLTVPITTGYVDLYLRVDNNLNLDLTTFNKDFITSKEFIEI